MTEQLLAPFPWFGGKRKVAADVWARLGSPKQYIEPFCGSAAILLAAPTVASLEVVGDMNGFIANFWRAVKYQPGKVAEWADYPVSHIDQGARHVWLHRRRESIAEGLMDAEWPGDAQAAGWWLWGQCSWIGSGWAEWDRAGEPGSGGQIPHVSDAGRGVQAIGKVPHVGNAGVGVQAIGKVPHVGNAGRGVQAIGQIPHVSNAGKGVQAIGQIPHVGNAGMGHLMTSAGRAAWEWLHRLADRLERVRIIHGDWSRCLNHHYGGVEGGAVAVFFDPPYRAYEGLYSAGEKAVADAVAEWAAEHAHLRIALCGHAGDYDLPGWDAVAWKRDRATYGSTKTTDAECIWYSPACPKPERRGQIGMFDTEAP
jgi:hypothetical protein